MHIRKMIMVAALVVGGFAGLSAMTGSAEAAQLKSRACKPTRIAVFRNRIVVKCAVIKSQAYTEDIPYYAMSVEAAGPVLDAIIQLLVSAHERGRTLRIWVDMGDYKSVPNCSGSDCRRLAGVSLR
ncbi:MAG: hypothetical protein IH996_08720 [Proteobacteria bacterium]|nr:hypothetical protein [Pseudomonadota bacterium]